MLHVVRGAQKNVVLLNSEAVNSGSGDITNPAVKDSEIRVH